MYCGNSCFDFYDGDIKMNERINELLVEADIKFDRDINEIEVCVMLPSDLEKFAELIVRECVELNKQELAFNAFERLLNIYKEHFGVKE